MWNFPLVFATGAPSDLGLQIDLDVSTLTIDDATGDETWHDTMTSDGQDNYLFLDYDNYDPTPFAKPLIYGVGSTNAYLESTVGGFENLATLGAYTPLTVAHDMRMRVTVNLTSAVTNTAYFRLGLVEFADGSTLEARVRTGAGPVLQLYAVYTDAANPGSPYLTSYRTVSQGISTAIGFRTESAPGAIDIITEIDGYDPYTTTVPLPMEVITSVTPFMGYAETDANDVELKLYKFEFTTL